MVHIKLKAQFCTNPLPYVHKELPISNLKVITRESLEIVPSQPSYHWHLDLRETHAACMQTINTVVNNC